MQQVLSHVKSTFHYCSNKREKHLAQTVYWLKYTHLYSICNQFQQGRHRTPKITLAPNLLTAKVKCCQSRREQARYCANKLTAQTDRYDFEVAFQCKIHIR